MGHYLPSTEEEGREMLKAVGLSDRRELYRDVPESVYLDRPLDLPEGMSEMAVSETLRGLAAQNKIYKRILRGAGAYDHYIPSIVKYIPAKEEFLTAYTPYQAEISQGVLQSIFEYQTMICELTGMEVSNASVYDGATAAAEAAGMCRSRKRNRILIAESVNPETVNVVKTYAYGSGAPVEVIPMKDGRTDQEALAALLSDDTACVLFQQPNFFGLFEDSEKLIAAAHAGGAMAVMSVNPIALGLMKTPGELGADVAVGEGQPLGMPIAYGGPYLGFMATTKKNMRSLPGRIVGQTSDAAGNRAFVLSLQAREQHIRREKASSNICSNEALCAMTAGLYMAAMGPDGLREVASQCLSKAHYLAAELEKIPGVHLAYGGDFFHEFVTRLPKTEEVLSALDAAGYLGGLPVDGGLLWCVTEKASKAELDEVVRIVKEVLA
ncbi:MAG: aminomethyl-transferring glycine dehydrogenase subunit GcvPA [Lachnospiraceae bacterium]|nr:aminomethyl-transferring glycine dehydrogenase subunit GcvPA [Lachnospiraceae bacterium]